MTTLKKIVIVQLLLGVTRSSKCNSDIIILTMCEGISSRQRHTDSGGFQVFSLAKLRNIKEEGVYFNSHIDGRKIFMGPEESMRIQSNLASTIAMRSEERL